MSKFSEEIKRTAFLSLFKIHLLRIKPYVTKEEILKKMKNKQCIFSGHLRYFKGDSWFREMRKYFESHCKDRGLTRNVFMIINQTLEEVK